MWGKARKAEGGEKKKDQSSGEEWKEWAENHSKHFMSLILVFGWMGLHEEWSVDPWSPFRLDQ